MSPSLEQKCCSKCMPGNPAWMACINSSCSCHSHQEGEKPQGLKDFMAAEKELEREVHEKDFENQESWSREFDGIWNVKTLDELNGRKATVPDFDAIKSFIHHLLQKQREELVGKIEGMLNTYSVNAPEKSRAATFTPEQFMSLLKEIK